jgi:hypothetical protein
METTHVSETSTLYNHTPGNYPKEDNIRSQHGESLKTRFVTDVFSVEQGIWLGFVKTSEFLGGEGVEPHNPPLGMPLQ